MYGHSTMFSTKQKVKFQKFQENLKISKDFKFLFKKFQDFPKLKVMYLTVSRTNRKFKIFKRNLNRNDFNVRGSTADKHKVNRSKLNDTMDLLKLVEDKGDLYEYYGGAAVTDNKPNEPNKNIKHNAYYTMTKLDRMKQLATRCRTGHWSPLIEPYEPYKECTVTVKRDEVGRMTKAALVAECIAHNLIKSGSVHTLRNRVYTHYERVHKVQRE